MPGIPAEYYNVAKSPDAVEDTVARVAAAAFVTERSQKTAAEPKADAAWGESYAALAATPVCHRKS